MLAFGASTLVAGPSTADAQSTQRFTLSGGEVGIWNLAGAISVEGGATGGNVQVQVTRRGPDGGRLRIETGRIRGRETLRVIYPDRRIVFDARGNRSRYGDSRTTLYVDDDGTFGEQHSDSRGERVEIRATGPGLEAAADVRVQVPRGQRIAIYLGAGDAKVTNVDADVSVDVHDASITTLTTRGALSLDAGSGEVSVTDAEGQFSLDAGSGQVRIARVRGPEITLDTGSGSVTASELDAPQVRVDAGSGGVKLRGLRSRDVSLDAGSGSVELQLVSDVDRLMVDAGSGGVTIELPESLGAMVSVETGSGGVDFDFPVSVTKRSRNYLAGQIGDGRGRITVETGSGSVRFRRN